MQVKGSEIFMANVSYVAVSSVEDVPPGHVKSIDLMGRSVLLCHSKGRIFAVENKCSHADEKLECGRMKAGWIACPLHGARFNLETGAAMNPPATQPIQTYDVRIIDGVVEVAIGG